MSEYIHVSVAWPYANGDMHVGHLAGCYLPADIFARYHRLKGNHVLMVSGSDAHGTPISVEADKLGLPARDRVRALSHALSRNPAGGSASATICSRTPIPRITTASRRIFSRRCSNGGYLYNETQRLLYSESEKRFLPDRYVEGTCPICGFKNARGDQCDNCGNLLDAVDLINPRSKTDGSTPVIRETEHYFLDLAAFRDRLTEYLAEPRKATHWRPQVLTRLAEQGRRPQGPPDHARY